MPVHDHYEVLKHGIDVHGTYCQPHSIVPHYQPHN
jgi:hypothetical protein